MQKKAGSIFTLEKKRGTWKEPDFLADLPLRRLVKYAIRAFLGLLLSTLLGLRIVATLRKQHAQKAHFPHASLDEVRLDGHTLQIYSYGRDLYAAMLEAIDNAQESIYLETYIWKGDEVGQEFKDHLARKAAEGVDVYVIFDSFANLVVPREFKVFPPEIHTLEYQPFNVIHGPLQALDPRRYGLDHRKLLVVDGYTGFIGGYNLGSLYATEWRDTHLRITGPVVSDLAHSFIGFWNRARPRDIITRRYPRSFNPHIQFQQNDALRLTFPIRDMYMSAIDKAEHSVLLTNAYFVPDHLLLDTLQEAARRGVDVCVLVPEESNHIIAEWLAKGYFTECLEAGIRIFCYQDAMIHAKTCVIDEQWVTIGTANMDRLSSIGNFEINVEIYNADLGKQMRKLFECDMTNAVELTLQRWQRRSWLQKLSEEVLRPLRAFF